MKDQIIPKLIVKTRYSFKHYVDQSARILQIRKITEYKYVFRFQDQFMKRIIEL